MDYSLDGKTFRSVSNTANGDVGAETIFRYRQDGRVVTATYAGGDVRSGHLIANVIENGQLDMRYHHVNRSGELMIGTCLSTPRRLPDGRLGFSEAWQWLSGDRSSGHSEIEEVVDVEHSRVETSTPEGTPVPIGPYSHIARVGPFITIGGTAGVDPSTGQLAGDTVYAQAKQILASFDVMLRTAGSGLEHVIHINVFLKDMRDFEEMNRAYVEMMGAHRPARTAIGVSELPKSGALLTMNLTAVTA